MSISSVSNLLGTTYTERANAARGQLGIITQKHCKDQGKNSSGGVFPLTMESRNLERETLFKMLGLKINHDCNVLWAWLSSFFEKLGSYCLKMEYLA